jgi:hypothetical protein
MGVVAHNFAFDFREARQAVNQTVLPIPSRLGY